MSDTGQGGGQRSWWEKPDAEPTPQDPYAAGASDQGQAADAHDPYRTPPPEAPTQAHPTTPEPPTQSLPRYGDAPVGNDQHTQQFGQQYGNPTSGEQPSPNQPYGSQYGADQYGQPSANQQYANQQQYGNQQYPNQQYPGQPYGNQSYPNQQYPNQQYPAYPTDQAPVTGMAHAVLWTSIGGLLLSWTLLGWIASIVALALTPGARREIIAANGAKRGLGFLLAGKICAWVNIGLTLLGVIGFIAFFGWLGTQGWQYDDGGMWDTNVSVLFHR